MSRGEQAEVATRIVATLIDRGVLAVTVYPEEVEVCGGDDSDTVVLTVDGAFTRDEVAEWFGVDPTRITDEA